MAGRSRVDGNGWSDRDREHTGKLVEQIDDLQETFVFDCSLVDC